MYLKQHNSLQVSEGKATLVTRVLRYVRADQQILEPEEDNDATSDSGLRRLYWPSPVFGQDDWILAR